VDSRKQQPAFRAFRIAHQQGVAMGPRVGGLPALEQRVDVTDFRRVVGSGPVLVRTSN
jgi:hypothetical protein